MWFDSILLFIIERRLLRRYTPRNDSLVVIANPDYIYLDEAIS